MTGLNGDNKVNDFTQISNWQFQNLLLKPVLHAQLTACFGDVRFYIKSQTLKFEAHTTPQDRRT